MSMTEAIYIAGLEIDINNLLFEHCKAQKDLRKQELASQIEAKAEEYILLTRRKPRAEYPYKYKSIRIEDLMEQSDNYANEVGFAD